MTTEVRQSVHAAGLRDSRYGEILLITGEGDRLKTAVYSTAGLNECPAEHWRSLDPHRLAKDFEVLEVRLNGPQYWAVDGLALYGEGQTMFFDGLGARLVGETSIPSGTNFPDDAVPYRDLVVGRKAEWVISKGLPASKLVSPRGEAYYMLAYSHAIDDSLSSGSLITLGNRLHVPEGWQYRVGSPVSDLVLRPVDGEAHLLRDELQNTYMRTTSSARTSGEPRRHENTDAATVKAAFGAPSCHPSGIRQSIVDHGRTVYRAFDQEQHDRLLTWASYSVMIPHAAALKRSSPTRPKTRCSPVSRRVPGPCGGHWSRRTRSPSPTPVTTARRWTTRFQLWTEQATDACPQLEPGEEDGLVGLDLVAIHENGQGARDCADEAAVLRERLG